ncbi:hypothetical protein ENBRE01_3256, partial [Enteropsectra breve]
QEGYPEWNLEEQHIYLTSAVETFTCNDIIQENNDLSINEEVYTHFEKYKARVERNCSVNSLLIQLAPGDLVLILKDFDANADTKKYAFTPSFELDPYEVIELLSENRVVLRNTEAGQDCSVAKNRVKKL